MYNNIRPGYVLRFNGTNPWTIHSPQGSGGVGNDNTLITAWPNVSNLGLVECFSHPSGAIAAAAAAVAKGMRPGFSIGRAASYSAPGQFLTQSNRPIGAENCNFVGYVDGETNQIQSGATVFSKDFSGCLMIAYTHNGNRHVAHASASQVASMDCKQSSLDTLQNMGATLIGWFKPFVQAQDINSKLAGFNAAKGYCEQIDHLTTFGIITSGNLAYSVDAFYPKKIGGNEWVVTAVRSKPMSQSWTA